MTGATYIGAKELREIAVSAEVDPRTVRRALEGKEVRSASTLRAIARACRALGYEVAADRIERGEGPEE